MYAVLFGSLQFEKNDRNALKIHTFFIHFDPYAIFEANIFNSCSLGLLYYIKLYY